MNITSKPFGQTPDGTDVHLYTLSNGHNLEVSITNYGGAITEVLGDGTTTPLTKDQLHLKIAHVASLMRNAGRNGLVSSPIPPPILGLIAIRDQSSRGSHTYVYVAAASR